MITPEGSQLIANTTTTLRDGVTVVVRQLSTADYDSVLRIADTLSDRERYFRFFTVHPGYIEKWAESLTTPSPGVVAVGAFDSGELVGVANYAASNQAEHAGEAEIAIVVAHDEHDRGVGTALLRELVRTARRRGEHHLIADVLAENDAMLRVIQDAHAPVTFHRDGAVFSIDMNLDALEEE